MKVAVLGPVHPYRGGIAHYTARLARELIAQGHEVLVVNLTRQYPSALFPGSTQEDTSELAFDVPAERWVDSLNPVSWARALRRILAFGADRLVVQWWHPYFAPSFGSIAYGARARGVEVCFVVHNALPHEPSPVDRIWARFAFRAAHRFVAHAEIEADRIRGLRRDARIAVNPHPVYDLFEREDGPSREEARQQLGIKNERVLLFFGLIRHYKGLDVLLDAMPQVAEQTGALLWVAGECYEDLSVYTRQVERLRLSDSVVLDARYIPNEDVTTLMAACDAVVLPYRHATQSGIVQVAYACERPVVTTRVGGLPEVVWDGETGLLVPPEDPPALAAALCRFYDEDLGPGLAEGVRGRVAQFGWARMAEIVMDRQETQ